MAGARSKLTEIVPSAISYYIQQIVDYSAVEYFLFCDFCLSTIPCPFVFERLSDLIDCDTLCFLLNLFYIQ